MNEFKLAIIFNALVDIVALACITIAAINFDSYRILFWYLIILFTGTTVKRGKEDKRNGS